MWRLPEPLGYVAPVTEVLGRAREIAALEARLDGALAGRGGLVRLVGEPGIGKTWLASSLAERAAARGVACVWARAWERAARAPFGVVRDLLAALRRADAARGPSEADDPFAAGSVTSRDDVVRAFSSSLVERRAPVLAIIDDLHAADLDSLELLLGVAPSLRTSRALVVATERSVDTGAGADALTVLDQLGRVSDTLEVGGLGVEAVAAMVARATGGPADARLVAALHRATLGNALFVDGVIRQAVRDGTITAGTTRVAPDVRRAVTARIEALGEHAAPALRVGAVLGRPFEASLVAEVLGLGTVDVDATLRVAESGGLVAETAGRYSFRHTLVADVLLSSLAPTERAGLHRAVLDVLGAKPAGATPLADIARHAVAALPLVGLPVAVASIDAAARHAAALCAHEEAMHLRAQAVELVGEGDARARLDALLHLGEAALLGGKRADARAVLLRAAGIARAEGDVRAVARAALGVAETGEFGAIDREKIALLDEAAAGAEALEPALRTRVLSRLGAALWMDPEGAGRRRDVTERCVAAARLEGDRAALLSALDARFQAIWGPSGRAERRGIVAEMRAISAGAPLDAETEIALRRHALFLAAEDGDFAAFSVELDGLEALADRLRRPGLAETVAQRRMLLALLRGEAGAAEALVVRVRELGLKAQNPQVDMGEAYARSLLSADSGDAAGLSASAERLAFHASRLPNLPFLRARHAVACALLGRDDEARTSLGAVLAQALPALDDSMITMATLASVAEVAWLLGDGRAAERALPLLEPVADRAVVVGSTLYLGSARRYVGLCAWTLGRHEEAVEALGAAHEDHHRAGAPPWIVRTARELSALLDAVATVEARARATELAEEARAYGVWPLEGRGAPLSPRPGPARTSDPPRGATASLVHEGQTWALAFAGADVRLRDSKGLRILAALLERPGVEQHALELSGAAELRSASGGVGPALDGKAIAAFRARMAELSEAREEAEDRGDLGARLRATEELSRLEEELSRAVGLGGRSRASGHAERARVAVAKALERALHVVERLHPAAHAHLARAVRTGVFCRYDPDPAVAVVWRVVR